MKTIKSIIIKLIFVLFAILITSCSNNESEQLFEDASTIRKEKREKELRNLLTSSPEGWKVVYFTDNKMLGGYTFLFKFKSEAKVEMASDFTNDYSIAESEYDVSYSSTTKLTFTTKNIIHDLSDSNNYPDDDLKGRGYKGNFEFLYYGTEGDDIIFRTNKSFIELRFKKAKAQDWEDLKKHEPIKKNINIQEGKSVFRVLKIGNEIYNFSYNAKRRFGSSTKNVPNSDVNFGVGFTPTGILVSPAIEINGKEVTEFTYNSEEDRFVAFEGSNEVASIEYSSIPASPLLGYKELTDFLDLNHFFNFPPRLDNAAFTKYFTNALNKISGFGVNVTRIVFLDIDKPSGQLVLVTNLGIVRYYFDKTIEDNKLLLTKTKSNVPPVFDTVFKPILDLFFDSEGIYVKKEGTLDGYTNLTYSFIPGSKTELQYSFFNR